MFLSFFKNGDQFSIFNNNDIYRYVKKKVHFLVATLFLSLDTLIYKIEYKK